MAPKPFVGPQADLLVLNSIHSLLDSFDGDRPVASCTQDKQTQNNIIQQVSVTLAGIKLTIRVFEQAETAWPL
jgi:hypothetical protein